MEWIRVVCAGFQHGGESVVSPFGLLQCAVQSLANLDLTAALPAQFGQGIEVRVHDCLLICRGAGG